MRTYWDSSALVAATLDARIRRRLEEAEAVTRSHALSEVFSTLTGSRLGFRVDADDVVALLRDLLEDLRLVDLSPADIMEALAEARSRGVRGGQVHDYLHAVTARSAGCEVVLTLNEADFAGLFDELRVEVP